MKIILIYDKWVKEGIMKEKNPVIKWKPNTVKYLEHNKSSPVSNIYNSKHLK